MHEARGSTLAPAARIPLVILAGSDYRLSQLPPSGAGRHPITGHKCLDVRIAGRPLLSHLLDRLEACGFFGPLLIAGPAPVFRAATARPTGIIDTDGPLSHNVRIALETLHVTHPVGPVAFMASDVLPSAEDLERAISDYRQGPPCSLWFPTIRVPGSPGALGAFGWKPGYTIRPARDAEPVAVLPGHLMIARPAQLRLSFMIRLSQAVYRVRNRSIERKRRAMVAQLLPVLLWQDLVQIATLRLPLVTCTMLGHGLAIARALRAGTLSVPDLEDSGTRMIVRRSVLRRDPHCRVRLPVLDALSLARDIDTREEADEAARDWVSGGAGS